MSTLQQRLRHASASAVALRTVRSHPQRPTRVTVSEVENLSRSMRRITLMGEGIADFPALGNDQYARLLLPRPGQLEPRLPTSARWYPELLAMDPDTRPWLRNYTLRHVRPDQYEVDLDVHLHPGRGPAATWAAAAAAGQVVGLIEQGTSFSPTERPLLLVADAAGLPAALSILESLPAEVHVTAVLEVDGSADQQPASREVVWVYRNTNQKATDVLSGLALPVGEAWLAGEAGMVTAVRRHLVAQQGWQRADITFSGYYRRGRPQYR